MKYYVGISGNQWDLQFLTVIQHVVEMVSVTPWMHADDTFVISVYNTRSSKQAAFRCTPSRIRRLLEIMSAVDTRLPESR